MVCLSLRITEGVGSSMFMTSTFSNSSLTLWQQEWSLAKCSQILITQCVGEEIESLADSGNRENMAKNTSYSKYST